MIRSFADSEAERIWHRDRSRKLPPDIQQGAVRRLTLLDAATSLDQLSPLPVTACTRSRTIAPGSTTFPLTRNGVYASSGRTETLMMSRSSTITDPDWLDNEHAGQLLVTEFLEPAELGVVELTDAIGVASERIASVVEGARPMDAELDLRLARYFRMSEGFFLRLRERYEIVAAKRALNGVLDRITPRAA